MMAVTESAAQSTASLLLRQGVFDNTKRRVSSFLNKDLCKREAAEEFEQQKMAYKPHNLEDLTDQTNFTRKEIKLLYRGFKENCPNGTVTIEKFREIFGNYFFYGNSEAYATMVFRTFDEDCNGDISFEEFVEALSILLRGTTEQRLRWIFTLYDDDRKGYLIKEDLERVVRSIYDLMGTHTRPPIRGNQVTQHANNIFQKLDADEDGFVTEEEFIDGCLKDQETMTSLSLFQTVFTA